MDSYKGRATPQPRLKRHWYMTIGVAFLVCFLILKSPQRLRMSTGLRHTLKELDHQSSADSAEAFDWESISPSRELQYVPCHNNYMCARLLLPIDWDAPESQRWSKTVAIALIKLPANVSDITDARHRGDLFVNPGGPGASGVDFALRRGKYLSGIVNSESAVFDIVGFDPRGVVHSTPRFSCFRPGNVQGRGIFSFVERTGSWSEDALPATWARSAAFAQMCDPGNDISEEATLKSFMSTASVARDLVGMIEASGRLRDAQLRRILKAREMNGNPLIEAARVEELAHHPGMEKLQYWGFSYGTMIGGYFASMFPDKVKRIVLDGSSHLLDYSSGRWMQFLVNSDKTWKSLFQACFAAGEAKCPIFDSQGPEAMEAAALATLAALKANPIPIWTHGMLYPEVLSDKTVIEYMFTANYNAYLKFPVLAQAMHALRNRHNLTVADISVFLPEQAIRCSDKDCTSRDCAEEDGSWYHEANVAVSCSDSDASLHNRTFADFARWARNLRNQSALFGSYFAADSTMACHAWPMRPKFRFDGPFGGNTSHPILFVGNTLDPVSPAENAVAMSQLFNGSVVLMTNAPGHCSPSVPSLCTAKRIGRYLHSGELPKPGTLCEPDYQVFEEPSQLQFGADGAEREIFVPFSVREAGKR
ncbi:hypothetical protein NQ176_g7346 [Zarea fungicola]|uniref:Uncharacterized protein n=1 Tax=Zarea fungicola TaxID=93591 RepID=A0ACC1MZC5_9HYPO|nr:hypothetical protein NQ176_g7346 [Lecanicillium fungicola]